MVSGRDRIKGQVGNVPCEALTVLPAMANVDFMVAKNIDYKQLSAMHCGYLYVLAHLGDYDATKITCKHLRQPSANSCKMLNFLSPSES